MAAYLTSQIHVVSRERVLLAILATQTHHMASWLISITKPIGINKATYELSTFSAARWPPRIFRSDYLYFARPFLSAWKNSFYHPIWTTRQHVIVSLLLFQDTYVPRLTDIHVKKGKSVPRLLGNRQVEEGTVTDNDWPRAVYAAPLTPASLCHAMEMLREDTSAKKTLTPKVCGITITKLH